jgi:hypothetical protein
MCGGVVSKDYLLSALDVLLLCYFFHAAGGLRRNT